MILENPYEKIERFRKEMDKLFNKYLKEIDITTAKKDVVAEKAKVNIKKGSRYYEYIVELPGVKKEDIELNIIGNILEIKARNENKKKEDKKNYIYKEFSLEEFYRAIPLPEDIETKSIDAKYENGVLTIKIPRRKKKSISKKVKIK